MKTRFGTRKDINLCTMLKTVGRNTNQRSPPEELLCAGHCRGLRHARRAQDGVTERVSRSISSEVVSAEPLLNGVGNQKRVIRSNQPLRQKGVAAM